MKMKVKLPAHPKHLRRPEFEIEIEIESEIEIETCSIRFSVRYKTSVLP